MIGLKDLRVDATAWDGASFIQPRPDRYNIAEDCLCNPHDVPAIIEVAADGDEVLTYGELDRRSANVARHLLDGGLRPGDRVAIKLSQGIDMAIAVFAVIRARGIVVPLSNVLAESGLRHRIGDAAPTIVIARDGDPVFDIADAAVALLTSRLAVITDDGHGDLPIPHTAPDEASLLLYTSGTTGKPKGVLHGHRVLLGHHAIDLAFDRVRPDDVAYSPVDWTWAGGMMLGLLVPLAHGIQVVAHRATRFDPAATFEIMQRTGVSIGLFPPTVLRMFRASEVLGSDVTASSRLRCFITGAEAVEPQLIEWGRSIGISINNAYGQTEANALLGHAATLEPALDQSTMGRPYPGHVVAVLDDQLHEVPDGDAGQLAVRADDLVCMLEYWNNPAATADKIRDGWLLTGDTAHRQPDGSLAFHGRSDDIIKSGAYRLGPAEIEAAMLLHPAIVECAAIGLPDDVRGEAVTAIVRVRSDRAADALAELTDELQALVRSHVGQHAYPRVVHIVDELPKTTTNKVDRAAIRAGMTKEHR